MISIIIPVLNEEKVIEEKLQSLLKLKGDKEIIVVDGGSKDNTVYIASRYATLINGRKGRAYQMNDGAKVAKGDILWFLHIDSKVSEESAILIEKAISLGNIGGGLRLYFYDLDTYFMKFVSWSSNLRAKIGGLYFGDQGIFIKREVFEKLGGFKEVPLMEDWDMAMRLKKQGKMKMIDSNIGTSARKFKSEGQLKTLLFMHKIKLLYKLGVSEDKLRDMYYKSR